MRTKHCQLLFCLLFPVIGLVGQTLPAQNQAFPEPVHRPGCPATIEQATAESLFDPSAPGYWNYDSSYLYQWLEPSATWYLYEKYKVTTNIAGYMTEGLYLEYDSVNGTWNNFTRYVNNYNANNTIISRQGQAWNTATLAWVDFSYTLYDAEGRTSETFYRTFNRVTNQFTNGNRSLYLHDAAGNTTEWTYQEWNPLSETWDNQIKQNSTFSSTNKLLHSVNYSWNVTTTAWDNSNKGDYTYDANDFLTGFEQFNWSATLNDWQNSYRVSYTNDLNGDPGTAVTENWNENTAAWDLYEYEEYQYSPFHKLTQHFVQYWSTVLSGWENYQWSEYGYWGNQVRATEVEKQWNPSNSTWVEIQGGSYDTSGYTLEYYYKYFDLSTYSFTGGYKYIYEYADQKPVLSLNQSWNVTLGTWVDNSRRLSSYDPAGNLVLELDQSWTGGTWADAFKMVHYYSEHLGMPGLEPVSALCFFNNPLRKGGAVNCPGLDPAQDHTLQLYSLNGQLILSEDLQRGTGVNIPGNIAPGIYIMEIRSQGKPVASGKVVVTD